IECRVRRAETLVHVIAELLRDGIESAHVQQRWIHNRPLSPTTQVVFAVQQEIGCAERIVYGQFESRTLRQPHLERIERQREACGLRPRTLTAVAPCNIAELLHEARANRTGAVGEQRLHSTAQCGVARARRIVNESAIVRETVAVDVARYRGRERSARTNLSEPADVDELEQVVVQ